MEKQSIVCVIPARYGSTRLPGKPLIVVGGLPIIMWTYNRAAQSGVFDDVYVATDDRRIYDTVIQHGGKAVMTSDTHVSGTDRVREAVAAISCTHVVNVQGDEPDIPVDMLKTLCTKLSSLNDTSLLTCISHAAADDAANPNVVKAVLNVRKEALYFSRAPIPWNRDGTGGSFFKHRGIYAFTKKGLDYFCSLPHGVLEQQEKLEQLRALEYGMTIHCFVYDYAGIGIDTPDDVERFKTLIER
jgi:3-deoxy-manno-octulosonate cytidylyltransferase (CMP-KDO synthetase)